MNERALSATLYLAIETWVGEQSQNADVWPDSWIHDEMIGQMTDAAMAVFLATAGSCKFTQENEK